MTKPIVVILDDFERSAGQLADWSAIETKAEVRIYEEPLRGAALVEALTPAQAVVLMRDRTPFTAELIAKLPALKLVIFTGTRNNSLDVKALQTRGIPVCHTEWGPSKDSTAELTWALILAAQKQLEFYMAGIRQAVWRPQYQLSPILHGKTIGLVGMGNIGSRVAKVAHAFGMEVLTWSPNMSAERAAAVGAKAVDFETLLHQSHIVSLHLVLSESTQNLMNEKAFALMRDDAIFVNTARAGLTDETALIAWLNTKHSAQAALDVFSVEPLPVDHPLLQTQGVTLTPHLGFVCQPVFENFYAGVSECLNAWLNEKPLPRQLDAV